MGYFIQYGEELRLTNRILVLIVIVLMLLVIILAFQIAGKKVIYVNPSSVVGTGAPGVVTDEYVEYFARYFLHLMGNFTSGTIEDMYQQALYLMKPSLVKSVVEMMNSEIEEASRSFLSIETYVRNMNVERTRKGLFLVSAECLRNYYAEGTLIVRKKIGYKLLIGKTDFRNVKNPFGLWVIDYEGPTDLGTVEEVK